MKRQQIDAVVADQSTCQTHWCQCFWCPKKINEKWTIFEFLPEQWKQCQVGLDEARFVDNQLPFGYPLSLALGSCCGQLKEQTRRVTREAYDKAESQTEVVGSDADFVAVGPKVPKN